jgi:DNA adenine methylase
MTGPRLFFFADPPYWQTEGYGVDFGFDQYERLAEIMRTIKGKLILTINDHPDMRKVFEGFRMEVVKIKYTVGGNNRGVDRQELVIMSW